MATSGDGSRCGGAPGLELDVARFRALASEASSAESLSDAVEIFSGDFLEGFALRDSPEFDHWQTGEADRSARAGSALRRLVALQRSAASTSRHFGARSAGSSSSRCTSRRTAS